MLLVYIVCFIQDYYYLISPICLVLFWKPSSLVSCLAPLFLSSCFSADFISPALNMSWGLLLASLPSVMSVIFVPLRLCLFFIPQLIPFLHSLFICHKISDSDGFCFWLFQNLDTDLDLFNTFFFFNPCLSQHSVSLLFWLLINVLKGSLLCLLCLYEGAQPFSSVSCTAMLWSLLHSSAAAAARATTMSAIDQSPPKATARFQEVSFKTRCWGKNITVQKVKPYWSFLCVYLYSYFFLSNIFNFVCSSLCMICERSFLFLPWGLSVYCLLFPTLLSVLVWENWYTRIVFFYCLLPYGPHIICHLTMWFRVCTWISLTHTSPYCNVHGVRCLLQTWSSALCCCAWHS